MQPTPIAKQPRISPEAPCSRSTTRTVSATPGARPPGSTAQACMRVLIVSTGYMATCSMTPAQLPAAACCQNGLEPSHSSHSSELASTVEPVPRSVVSPLYRVSAIRTVSYVPQHTAAEGIARPTRGPRPRKKPLPPSCSRMVRMVETKPVYFGAPEAARGACSPPCVCSRVLTTSRGIVAVAAKAPLTPAEKKYHGAPDREPSPAWVPPVPMCSTFFKDSFMATNIPM
mmetsp:Transcript_109267/g.284845  ORF Transcript_109267/g.284845 Transcript_109267/m.284845 type:complete len:229 (-) Transcript_109267:262-948(-)